MSLKEKINLSIDLPFAKKALGQHFLIHRPILKTLSDRAFQHQPQTVLEIGPGPGLLTRFLTSSHQLILIEKDARFEPDLIEIAQYYPSLNLEIFIDDVLKIDLEKILSKTKAPRVVVGNLPYNISVPILIKLLQYRNLFTHFYLMFQKEVAQRITAKPSTKSYGSLSLYCQLLADCKLILPIPASAFKPRPKVESAVVEIIPLANLRYEDVDILFFEKIIQLAFKQRRKNILNNLYPLIQNKSRMEEFLISIQIDPRCRAESLSLEEFVKLVKQMHVFLDISSS